MGAPKDAGSAHEASANEGTGVTSNARDSGNVRSKLIMMAVSTTFVALVVAALAMLLVDLRAFQRYWTDDLMTQADIVARVTAPALAFNDDESARQNLAVLKVRPQILAAAIYNSTGARFATYEAVPGQHFPARAEPAGYRIEGGEVVVFRNIVENGEMVGSVYVRSRYGLVERLLSYGAILGAVMLGALVIAGLVASRLQAAITRPIEAVTNVARQVMQRRDFTLRVPGNERGEIGVLVEAFNDMLAEIGRRSQALQESNATLEHEMDVRQRAEGALLVADRRKDEFLATLAHELRNPLAPIRTGLAVLGLGGDKPEAVARIRAMMERQVSHMVHLVDDLLDVARISSGKVDLKIARVDVKAVIASAVETSQPLIDAAQHQLSVTLSDMPLWLDADLNRLAQVVGNLLTNAAKYTLPGGQIHLHASRDERYVLIAVTDSGMGIPRAELPTVFDMFTQVSTHAPQAQGGLGIGLSLVRHLVELHGGSVAVHSEGEGHGSTFEVRLPLADTGERRKHVRPSTAPDPMAHSGLNVLIADDNEDAAAALSEFLRIAGHHVTTVNNGHDAVRTAGALQPDAILLDIGMPGMNGYEVARALRSMPEMKKTVLVALTGWGTDDDRSRASAAGFDHHLTKPTSAADIVKVLETARHRES